MIPLQEMSLGLRHSYTVITLVHIVQQQGLQILMGLDLVFFLNVQLVYSIVVYQYTFGKKRQVTLSSVSVNTQKKYQLIVVSK